MTTTNTTPDIFITIPETQEQVLRDLLVENGDRATPAYGGCPKCGTGLAAHRLKLDEQIGVVYHSAICLDCGWKQPLEFEAWNDEVNYSERFGLIPTAE